MSASQLVIYAKQIAIYRGYDNLVNGLQPVEVLQSKYEHELNDEFDDALHEAVSSGKILHVLHESADVLYYAACLDAQYGTVEWYKNAMFEIRKAIAQRPQLRIIGIRPEQIEAAAIAKYGYRSAASGNKNEQYELDLIEQVL